MVEVDKHQVLSRAFLHSDATQSLGADDTKNMNNDCSATIKRYLVYMELPKIKIGDYHKSSCVVGNILRFHFLMKIAQNEDETLRLLPIKFYKVPVVNVAVIHRPFIEDEMAKGPIPKSPDVKSPLIRYEPEDDGETQDGGALDVNLAEDFRRGSAGGAAGTAGRASGTAVGAAGPSGKAAVITGGATGIAGGAAGTTSGATGTAGGATGTAGAAAGTTGGAAGTAGGAAGTTGGAARTTGGAAAAGAGADNDDDNAPDKRLHRDSRHKSKKRKKYFVYCELPKVAIGDYRISSVTSSELIHCHFLMKIAKDEAYGQPVLRPIKKYRRPRVNFAVIHRSLIVDDEAAGPIPRSPGLKSPMIREDMDGDDDDGDEGMLHATMGFNYGAAAPRSKYELLTQWSLVADDCGRLAPELVLTKAGA